jgi:hypothetical protein
VQHRQTGCNTVLKKGNVTSVCVCRESTVPAEGCVGRDDKETSGDVAPDFVDELSLNRSVLREVCYLKITFCSRQCLALYLAVLRTTLTIQSKNSKD